MSSSFHLPLPHQIFNGIGRGGSIFARKVRELSKLAAGQAAAVFPGHTIHGLAGSRVEPPHGSTLHPLATAGGNTIAALYAAAPDASAHHRAPTILFFYGNDMCMRMTVPIFQLLRKLGVNVLVPEYVGYGLSDGSPSERSCYATADAAYDFLLRQPEVDPSRIIVAGCSLGGAVAIDLAARRKVAGVATLVTFTSMRDMACRFYHPLLVRLVLKYQFNNCRKIRKVKCPVLIGHSTGDRFVPYEMADRLAAAAGGPVSRLTIDGAEHNSESVLAAASQKILAAFGEFVKTCTETRVRVA